MTLGDHIVFARRLTTVLDTKFNVLGIRFGIDPLLDAIPGLGNTLAAATSCYLFWIARKINVPRQIYLRMAWNILADYALGIIPVAGLIFDIFYKSNVKNLALLEQFFDPKVIEGEIVDG